MSALEKKPPREGGRVLLVVLFAVCLVLLAWIVLRTLKIPYVGGGALGQIKPVPFRPQCRGRCQRPLRVVVNIVPFVGRVARGGQDSHYCFVHGEHAVSTSSRSRSQASYSRIVICSQLGLVNPGAQDAELRVAGCDCILVDYEGPSRIVDCLDWVVCLDYFRPGDVGLAPSPVRRPRWSTGARGRLQQLPDDNLKEA